MNFNIANKYPGKISLHFNTKNHGAEDIWAQDAQQTLDRWKAALLVLSFFLAMAALLLLPGCATILGKTSHEMQVSSSVAGAKASAVVLDSDGKVTKVFDQISAPGSLKIKLGFGDRYILVEAPGYERHLYKIETNVQTMAWVNVFVMPPGLIVDAFSGAFWEPEKSFHEARLNASTVVLKNGLRLQGRVIAKENGFQVTLRNGERFIARNQVREIKFNLD